MRKGIIIACVLLLALPGLAGAQMCNGCGLGYWAASSSGAGVYLPLAGGTLTGPIVLSDGTAATPAIYFGGSAQKPGFYRVGDTLAFAQGGTPTFIYGYSASGAQVGAGSAFAWAAGTSAAGPADLFLYRDTANTLAQKNANADQFSRLYGANGGYWERGVNSELLTIAAAPTTDTTGNLLPANAIIEAVVVRVTTVIPTAATFTVGEATTAARFATGVAVAADTTAVGLLHRNPADADAAGPVQSAAAKVRITPDVQPAAATGIVRIEVFFSRFVPPTS